MSMTMIALIGIVFGFACLVLGFVIDEDESVPHHTERAHAHVKPEKKNKGRSLLHHRKAA